jgi:hypothetical protein
MIVTYYDTINRVLIQTPGNQTPQAFNPFVYGDNFDLAIYLVQNGAIQSTINSSDTITILLFEKAALPPYTNLCIPGTASIQTDGTNHYFQININLATVNLAALVQATGLSATCALHIIYSPADGERISDGIDTTFIVNVDPTQGSTGGTPTPPGYPSNPAVFQLISGKDVASGYVGLSASTLMNPNEIPLGAGLSVVSGQLTASGGGGGSGPDLTTFATFTIPAKSATVAVTVAANTDLVVGMLCTLTDGTNFILGKITNIAGLVITFKNLGVGSAVSGTMGAGVLFIGGVPDLASPTLDGLLPQATNTAVKWLRDDISYQTLPAAGPNIAGTITGPSSPTLTQFLRDDITYQTVPPILTTFATFAIPASGSTVVVTVAAIPDFITNEVHVLTDGTRFMVGTVTSISGLNITYTNVGTGAVSGTMGTGRVYMAAPTASSSGGIGQHGARRYNSSTITYSTAGTIQALTFDTNVFDTDTYYGSGKFTIPTGQAGYYSIGASVNFAYVASQTFVFLAARLNGTTNNNIAAAQTSPTLNGSQSTTLNISTIYHLNVGDYIEIVVEEGAVASNLTAAYFGGVPSAWLLRIS